MPFLLRKNIFKLALSICTLAVTSATGAYAQPGDFSTEAEYSEVAKSYNSLVRIDSLTLKLFSTGSFSIKNYCTPEEKPVEEDYLRSFKINDSIFYSHTMTLESGIPLQYNSYVEGAIKFYALRRKTLLERVLAQGQYYFPIFEEILDKNGLPLEFKYLAVIESALNPNAVSWCGATGLWQFMPYTGKMYDLRIDDMVDQRKSLYHSTEAACQYFKNMYDEYGDWLLCIAAYNCGPGNVNKAIRRSGGKKDFWAIKRYLPRETSAYVPYFIAATYLLNFNEEHQIFADTNKYFEDDLTVIHLSDQAAFFSIAEMTGVTVETLKTLNPEYKRGIIIPEDGGTEPLVIPYQYAMLFAKHEDSIYQQSAVIEVNEPVISYYTVKKGDGFYTITSKYGCSVSDIKRWNNNVKMLHPGQRIKIYTRPMPNGFIKP